MTLPDADAEVRSTQARPRGADPRRPRRARREVLDLLPDSRGPQTPTLITLRAAAVARIDRRISR